MKLDKIKILVIVCALGALVFSTQAGAVEYVDIDQSLGFTTFGTPNDWQQTFVPSANNITAVSVKLVFGGGPVLIQIKDVVCGTILAHGQAEGPEGWLKVDLVGAEALVPGNTYVIDVDTAVLLQGDSSNDYYPDGELYKDCTLWFQEGSDLIFKTWANTDPVSNDDSAWGSIKSLYR